MRKSTFAHSLRETSSPQLRAVQYEGLTLCVLTAERTSANSRPSVCHKPLQVKRSDHLTLTKASPDLRLLAQTVPRSQSSRPRRHTLPSPPPPPLRTASQDPTTPPPIDIEESPPAHNPVVKRRSYSMPYNNSSGSASSSSGHHNNGSSSVQSSQDSADSPTDESSCWQRARSESIDIKRSDSPFFSLQPAKGKDGGRSVRKELKQLLRRRSMSSVQQQ
jgi:hypothetical protein